MYSTKTDGQVRREGSVLTIIDETVYSLYALVKEDIKLVKASVTVPFAGYD